MVVAVSRYFDEAEGDAFERPDYPRPAALANLIEFIERDGVGVVWKQR